MKFITGLCISAGLIFAAPQDSTKTDKTASSKTASSAKAAPADDKPPTTIPADAQQIEPGAFRWTDAKGRKWILFQTPFGIARKEDTGEPLRKKQQEARTMQGVKITEDGDSLKFEREGPFGMYRWSKKKADLTDEEKAAWQSQQDQKDKTPAAASAAKSAGKQDR